MLVYVDLLSHRAYIEPFEAIASGAALEAMLQLEVEGAETAEYVYLCSLPDDDFVTAASYQEVAALSLAYKGLGVLPVRVVGRHLRAVRAAC